MKTVEELNKLFTPCIPEDSKSIILRGDEILSKALIWNPMLIGLQLDPNKDYKVYIRDNIHLDWISNCSSVGLRRYKSPEGAEKKMVDDMIRIFMSDPDYPMDEFVYDLIIYGYKIKGLFNRPLDKN